MASRNYSSSEFEFDVPERLIAQAPPAVRGTCRLMRVDRATGAVSDHRMSDIASILPAGALVVFNDSRVRKARLVGLSETGGRVEFLLVEPANREEKNAACRRWLVLTSRTKRQRRGRRYTFPGNMEAEIVGEAPPYKIAEFSHGIDDAYLERHGRVPLPPYIRRPDAGADADAERYQTVYARPIGSVAAPTAGLHFTEKLIAGLRAHGFEVAYLTLHVGIGTFLPIRSESIGEHRMHVERYNISWEVARLVNRAIDDRRPVVAVGTTVVRALEAAVASEGRGIREGRGSTELFIRPGYEFRIVSSMFTNLHTPRSSLVVMVSAFAGVDLVRAAYRCAVEWEYRFFSYGDAMLIV